MIIPVGDRGRTRTFPFVNWLLILANIAIFIWVGRSSPAQQTEIIETRALRPDHWQDLLTFVTSMFLHGSIPHLLGNMLFLYIAGDNVEDRVGHVAYLVFYLAAGIVGAAAHVAYAVLFRTDMASVPTVGASGAISGVMGAFLIFFPKVQIKFVLWLILFLRAFTLPAWGVLGLWVASQVVLAYNQWHGVAEKEAQMVAVFAHLGGFAFGVLVGVFARMFGKAPSPKGE